MTQIEPSLVARFAADLDALVEPGERLGVAVSGGPDSLALLLLAAAARPGMTEAATVDHGLRPESRSEADSVASICRGLGVPHSILRVEWDEPPKSNVQAAAREARYAELAAWATSHELVGVATAHHADDQAETLIMRLARGSGVGGLAGAQRSRRLAGEVRLIRPLLGWRRAELRSIVDAAGLDAVDDPTNADERYDRTRARAMLQAAEWFDAERVAASASHLADAEQALQWIAATELAKRRSTDGPAVVVDPSDLPREIQRRLLLIAIRELSGTAPPGPDLAAALGSLIAGKTVTLAGLKLEGGSTWRLSAAPPRKR